MTKLHSINIIWYQTQKFMPRSVKLYVLHPGTAQFFVTSVAVLAGHFDKCSSETILVNQFHSLYDTASWKMTPCTVENHLSSVFWDNICNFLWNILDVTKVFRRSPIVNWRYFPNDVRASDLTSRTLWRRIWINI